MLAAGLCRMRAGAIVHAIIDEIARDAIIWCNYARNCARCNYLVQLLTELHAMQLFGAIMT